MATQKITFRTLDGNIDWPEPGSALEVWYQKVRDIDLAEMGVGDLARACRQKLYTEALVPFCLKALEEDPLAGAMYDGELVQALKKLPSSYWREHAAERNLFLHLAALGYEQTEGEHWHEELHVVESDLLR